MTIETKTREGAKVNSRLAAFSEYRIDPQNIAVGNKAPIGSLTFEQMDLGVWYPNTEAAINDLMSLQSAEIGTIICNDTGISPQPAQQITRATFSGVVSLEPKEDGSVGDPVIIHILGLPIRIANGDDFAAVATRWYDKVKELEAVGKVVQQVTQSPATPQYVDIIHLDYQNHNFETYKKYGLTVEFTVTSPAKAGYGQWDAIGNESKTFGANTFTFHYFRRMG